MKRLQVASALVGSDVGFAIAMLDQSCHGRSSSKPDSSMAHATDWLTTLYPLMHTRQAYHVLVVTKKTPWCATLTAQTSYTHEYANLLALTTASPRACHRRFFGVVKPHNPAIPRVGRTGDAAGVTCSDGARDSSAMLRRLQTMHGHPVAVPLQRWRDS